MTPSFSVKGTTTNGATLEAPAPAPGFWTCTVRVPAALTSPGCRVMVQRSVVWQTVARGDPLIRIVDAAAPVLAAKPVPTTATVKLEATPAITLEGRSC